MPKFEDVQEDISEGLKRALERVRRRRLRARLSQVMPEGVGGLISSETTNGHEYAAGEIDILTTDDGATKTVELGFTPKVVLLFASTNANASAGFQHGNTAAARVSWGATDNSNSWSVSNATHYGSPQVTQSNSTRAIYNNRALTVCSQQEVDLWHLDHTGTWDNNFKLLVTGAPTGATRRVFYLALGGDNVQADVGSYLVPNSAGGDTVELTHGFQADWLMCAGVAGGSAQINSAASHGYTSLGFTNGTDHVVSSVSQIDAQVNWDCGQLLDYTKFDGLISQGATPTENGPTCSTVSTGATSTTLTYTNRKATSAYRGYVAVKGIGLEIKQDTKPATDTTTDVTVTNQPQAAIFMSHGGTATTGTQGKQAFGVYDGTNQYAIFHSSVDNSNYVPYQSGSDEDALLFGNNVSGTTATEHGRGKASFPDATTIRTTWTNTNTSLFLFAVLSLYDN